MKTETQQINTIPFNKLQKKIRGCVGKAVADYNMIEAGDVIMACASGGKDSHVMIDVLLHLQKTAPIDFKVVVVNLDQKQPDFPAHILPDYFENLGVPYYIIDKDTFSVVKAKIPEGKTTCGLCSRLRRGTLYAFAEKIGATKIALGHHMDDIVETLFLSMFFNGKLKGMPPKLLSDDQRNIVIRPLSYCREKDLQHYANIKAYPIIPCNLCGSQENLQRQNIKAMLNQWDTQSPGRVENVFNSLKEIAPSQLCDSQLFNFVDLSIDRTGDAKPYEFEEAEISSSNLDQAVEITFDPNPFVKNNA
jgi:tRNA 2-thiocytidine biosynthesis protein TtcA